MNLPGNAAQRGGTLSGIAEIGRWRQLGAAAERAGDWLTAAECWQSAHELAPGDAAILAQLGRVLIAGGRAAEASSIIEAAGRHFADEFDVVLVHALGLQEEGRLDAALARWRHAGALQPGHPVPPAAEAAILYAQARHDEAEAIVAAALETFPADIGIQIQAALIAAARSDWGSAASRLEALRSAHAGHPMAVPVLENLGRIVPAPYRDQAHRAHVRTLASAAEREGNWAEACRLLKTIHDAGARDRETVLNYGRACREGGDTIAAETVLAEAAALFPDDAEIAANHAQVPARAREWREAAHRWRLFLERFPQCDFLANLAADAFERDGRAADAKKVLSEAFRRYPDRIDFLIKQAHIAQNGENWAEAVAYWDEAHRRMPDEIDIRNARGYAIWHASFHEGEEIGAREQEREPAHQEAATRLKALALQFEGLGDNCEFGFVQRHFGAEPLGLFRFSAVEPEKIIGLLDDKFGRLGDPAHTRLHLSESGMFMVEDDRGYYRMHTFIRDEGVDRSALLAQQIKRIRFLKRELITDLESGEKILVCKDTQTPIPDETLRRLSRAAGAYATNVILGIRLAAPGHPAGSVERVGAGIFVGYVATMYNSEPAGLGSIDFAAWSKIMETTARLRQDMDNRVLQ